MPNQYVPDQCLPIYPTYSTMVKHGVKYKAYFETDWHQVMTEDGVPLCDLLKSLPILENDSYYRFCGTLRNKPCSNSCATCAQKCQCPSAMDQLYALTTQTTGDVYLVETNLIADGAYVCEIYVWLGNEHGWIYHGTTNRVATIMNEMPQTLRLIPEEVGQPGEVLVVSEDGKSIIWGNSEVTEHNEDPDAHPAILRALELKADKLSIYNDNIVMGDWIASKDFSGFEYLYSHETNLPANSYFEITPMMETAEESRVVAAAKINSVYRIDPGMNGVPIATLKAKHVPTADIPICVKVFGTYDEK